jgi:hypothetical protein
MNLMTLFHHFQGVDWVLALVSLYLILEGVAALLRRHRDRLKNKAMLQQFMNSTSKLTFPDEPIVPHISIGYVDTPSEDNDIHVPDNATSFTDDTLDDWLHEIEWDDPLV